MSPTPLSCVNRIFTSCTYMTDTQQLFVCCACSPFCSLPGHCIPAARLGKALYLPICYCFWIHLGNATGAQEVANLQLNSRIRIRRPHFQDRQLSSAASHLSRAASPGVHDRRHTQILMPTYSSRSYSLLARWYGPSQRQRYKFPLLEFLVSSVA